MISLQGKQNITIRASYFLVLSLLYFIVSFSAFKFTSGGWTAFLMYGFGGMIFFVANYIFLCAFVGVKRPNYLSIPKKWILILIYIQIIALLFNTGDYGDNKGSFSFFEVLLGRNPRDSINFNREPMLGSFAGLFTFLGVVSYMVCLISLEVKIFRGAVYNRAIKNKFLAGRKFNKIDILGILIIFLGFVYVIKYFLMFQFYGLTVECLFLLSGVGLIIRNKLARIFLCIFLPILFLTAVMNLLAGGNYFWRYPDKLLGPLAKIIFAVTGLLLLVQKSTIDYFRKNTKNGGRMRIFLALFFAIFLLQTQLCMASEEANKIGNDGLVNIKNGKMDEGLALIKKATQVAPDDANWHMNYGSMLFLKGQQVFQAGNKQEGSAIFKEVEKELLLAVKLFKESNSVEISQCYFLLGDIYYYAFEDPAKAKSFYQKSLEYYPKHGGAIEAMKRFK